MTDFIKIENLHKSFNGKKVLNGVFLNIKEASSNVIIGGSGTGKSVLIKHIAMIMEADKGTIYFKNKDISNFNKQDRAEYMDNIGYLFQAGALFDSLTIWENISFKLLNKGISRTESKSRAIEVLKDVGLDKKTADLLPSELSGGMQKRASLARTVITKPKIIFFDEPTTGLDPIMAEAIDNLIVKQTKKLGATAITITHDIASMKKVGENISMLSEGKIIWQGDKKDIISTKNKIVKSFINGRH
jgi:phospholipid/cholesterol/gamma-HCH transport system ATP-binding protein